MLTRVRDFLQARQVAPLSEIAQHLGVPPEVARPMVERWVRKGRVERVETAGTCGTCDRCGVGALEVYRWRDSAGSGPCAPGPGRRR